VLYGGEIGGLDRTEKKLMKEKRKKGERGREIVEYMKSLFISHIGEKERREKACW
jgi:hypothetical protein